MSSTRDVLRRGDDRHALPHLGLEPLVARPDLVRRHSASSPCRPVRAPSRRWEKNRSGLQAVQRSTRTTSRRRRRRSSACSAALQRSSRPRRTMPAPKRVPERRGHVLRDLVAARADAGADRSRQPAAAERRRPALRRCRPSRPRQPTWSAAIAGRVAVEPRERDGQAVGGEDEQGLTRACPTRGRRPGRRARPRAGRAVRAPGGRS